MSTTAPIIPPLIVGSVILTPNQIADKVKEIRLTNPLLARIEALEKEVAALKKIMAEHLPRQ